MLGSLVMRRLVGECVDERHNKLTQQRVGDRESTNNLAD